MARMEDVLDLYHEDYDPDHRRASSFDETSKHDWWPTEGDRSIGSQAGLRVERYDYEYKRNGTRRPVQSSVSRKLAWRHVEVTERRICCGLRSSDWRLPGLAGPEAYPAYKNVYGWPAETISTLTSWVRCTDVYRASRSAADRQLASWSLLILHSSTRQLAETLS